MNKINENVNDLKYKKEHCDMSQSHPSIMHDNICT